jgi:transketolase
VLEDAPTGEPDILLIATGSEGMVARKAKEIYAAQGIWARVVSMPSTTVFDRQDLAYRRWLLPNGAKRVAIEAGTTALWWKYVGLEGGVIGIDSFGESAPASVLFSHFGITAERISEAARVLLESTPIGFD